MSDIWVYLKVATEAGTLSMLSLFRTWRQPPKLPSCGGYFISTRLPRVACRRADFETRYQRKRRPTGKRLLCMEGLLTKVS